MAHAQDVIGNLLRQIDFVQGHDHCELFFAHQLFENGQQFKLIADIQK